LDNTVGLETMCVGGGTGMAMIGPNQPRDAGLR
jgi:hypothetical protein